MSHFTSYRNSFWPPGSLGVDVPTRPSGRVWFRSHTGCPPASHGCSQPFPAPAWRPSVGYLAFTQVCDDDDTGV